MSLSSRTIPFPLVRLADLLVPSTFLVTGAVIGLLTFLRILLIERKPRLAFNFSHWQGQSFATIWKLVGPTVAKWDIKTVPALAGLAEGVVLDLGPGSGLNIKHFDRGKITKLYLVEPCIGLHEELKANVKKAGLDDVAVIIPCGAEDTSILVANGIRPSSIDTVCTVKVLCSVPDQVSICRSLYSALKPGGTWVIYEHVIAEPRYPLTRFVQHVYQIFWPTLLGGCNVTRDTRNVVLSSGEWEKVELGRDEGEGGWETLGHIVGRLVKKK